MTNLEAFQRSARQCGYEVEPTALQSGGEVWISGNDIADGTCLEWNPYTNDSQRWQCVVKLLENDGVVIIVGEAGDWHEYYRQSGDTPAKDLFSAKCPASEFPARALAELDQREK